MAFWSPLGSRRHAKKEMTTSMHCLSVILVALLSWSPVSQQAGQSKQVRRIDEAERTAFQKGKNVAVVVGVGAYPQSSGLRKLNYARKDGEEIAEELAA